MTNRLRILLALCLGLFAAFAAADGEATWSARLDRADVRAGEIARVVITGKLKPGWHAYSIVPVPEGPYPTQLTQPPKGDGIQSAGALEEDPPHEQFDTNFGKQVGTFEDTAVFYAPIRVKEGKSGALKLALQLKYEICNAQNCMPPTPADLAVDFKVDPGPARAEFATYVPKPKSGATQQQAQPANAGQTMDETSARIKKAQDAGLLPFVLFAFGMGLLSLLTPCVFPMIPITVSFFSKQKSEDGKLSYAGPVAYCLGIIGTFTGLGVLVGSTGLNRFATNVWVNIGLSALFIFLAASLFGVFELRLPSWLVNKASSKSRSGGLVGPLVMGLTFTLTSFTCTVPFVGTLLATSAQGGLMTSIIGMLAYSTAFALPFFLLALFPGFLGKLPRSGAWLVTVKAFMGFLELMAALKFLSNVDLSYSLGWLTRPVFLAVWAMTAAIGGMYLLGWLKLPHDGDAKIGWIRRGFGVATVALAVFCLYGMNGGKLGELAAFLPPSPYPGQADDHKGPLNWESTYEAALSKAKATGKNVFIDFTGIYCTNCRDIEENVFTQPEVEKELGKFVLARLFTDHQNSPEDEANQKLQISLSQVKTLPVYVVVSPSGQVLKVHQQEPPLEDAEQFLKAIRPFSSPAVASR